MGELALSEALGWPLEGFREAFAEVFAKGMVLADWKKRLIFIPNSVKYNPPESPNVIRSWRGFWELIPECSLKDDIQQQLKDFAEGLGKGFAKALTEVFGEDYGESGAGTGTVPAEHQEQEQESPPPSASPQIQRQMRGSARAVGEAEKIVEKFKR